ncbi:hypothetical protein [Bernardetia sp. MNP-M8]|uniref:hypothetical protein n=1 Tax=Bernardetia sp. MNP-M8 TaxID=3127470 RepID=UPI0030CA699D
MRNLIIFTLLLFLVASISLDAFADNSPTPDHDIVLIGNPHVGTDLITSFGVNHTVILIITDTEIFNRDSSPSIPILSTIDFVLPTRNDTNINRSDCNYPTTSFVQVIVQRSFSELSTKDYSQRNTNVVPIEKVNSLRNIKAS